MEALSILVREATRLPYATTAPVFLESMGVPLYTGEEEEAYDKMCERLPFQGDAILAAKREYRRTGKHPVFEFRIQKPMNDAFLSKKRPTWEWTYVYPNFNPRNTMLMSLPAVFRIQYDRILEENERNDRRMSSVWLKYIMELYKTESEAQSMFPNNTSTNQPTDDIRRPLHTYLTRPIHLLVDEFCTYDEFVAQVHHQTAAAKEPSDDIIRFIPTDVTYFLREPVRDIRAQHADPNSPLSLVEDTLRRRYALIDVPLAKILKYRNTIETISKTVPVYLQRVVDANLFDIHDAYKVFRGEDYIRFEGWMKTIQEPLQDLEGRVLNQTTRDDAIKQLIDAVDYRNRQDKLVMNDDQMVKGISNLLSTAPTSINDYVKLMGEFPFVNRNDGKDDLWLRAIIKFVATPFVGFKALPWLEAAKRYMRDHQIPSDVDGQQLDLSPPDKDAKRKPQNMSNREFNFFYGIVKNVRLMSARNLQLKYFFAFTEAFAEINPSVRGADALFDRLASMNLVSMNPNSGFVIRDKDDNRSWLLYQAITADGNKIRARMRARKRELYAEAKRWRPQSEPQPGDEELKPSLIELLEEAVESGEPIHPSDEVSIHLMDIDDIYNKIHEFRDRLDLFSEYVREWFTWRDSLGYKPAEREERDAVENVSSTIRDVCDKLQEYHDARVSLQNDALEYQQRRNLWSLDQKEQVVARGHQKEQTWFDMHTLNEKTAEYLMRASTLTGDDTDFDTGLYIENKQFRIGPLKPNSPHLVKVTRYLPDFQPENRDDAVQYYRELFSNFGQISVPDSYNTYIKRVR